MVIIIAKIVVVPYSVLIVTVFSFSLSPKRYINLPVLQGKMSHVLPLPGVMKGRRNVFLSSVVSVRASATTFIERE